MKCIGIDVSKLNFTVAFPTGDVYRLATFSNDSKGIKSFIGSLADRIYHCVLWIFWTMLTPVKCAYKKN
jgi:hypothetical protein